MRFLRPCGAGLCKHDFFHGFRSVAFGGCALPVATFHCPDRGTTQARDLPGRPDIALSRQRVVIFVHGCFWHRHACFNGRRLPKSRVAFWRSKLESNKRRDVRIKRHLRTHGWSVFVIWECQIRQPTSLERRIHRFLATFSPGTATTTAKAGLARWNESNRSRRESRGKGFPPLPKPDVQGNVPALEFVRATIARDIIRERKALGLTQQQLAKLAGVRQETVCRLETGRHSPTVRTVEKIEKAVQRAADRKRRLAVR